MLWTYSNCTRVNVKNSTNIVEYSNNGKAPILSLMRHAAVHEQGNELVKLLAEAEMRGTSGCKEILSCLHPFLV